MLQALFFRKICRLYNEVMKMKKYYALFWYDEKLYVVRFKSKEWRYDEKAHCFIDSRYYIRSIADLVAMAIFGTSASNVKALSNYAYLLTHDEFVKERACGTTRWVANYEIIK